MDNDKVADAISKAIKSIEPIKKHANIIDDNITFVENIRTTM